MLHACISSMIIHLSDIFLRRELQEEKNMRKRYKHAKNAKNIKYQSERPKSSPKVQSSVYNMPSYFRQNLSLFSQH